MKSASKLALTFLLAAILHLPSARAQDGDQKPRDPAANQQAGIYLARARAAFADRRYEDAIALATREIAINPSEASAYRIRWEAMLKRTDYEKEAPVIRSEIEALLKSNAGREAALLAALWGYAALADPDGQKNTEDLYIKEFPRSGVTRNILRSRAFAEPDKKKQIDLIEDFIARFPDDPNLAYMYPLLFRGLANRADEPSGRIARIGEAWIKSVTAPYDLISSRWAVAVALAERRFDLDLAQSVIDKAVKITDEMDVKSPLLGTIRQDERAGLIAMLKRRAHMGRGFVLLRRGKIEEASGELGDSLQPIIEQVEKNGYVLWKDMDLREIRVRPSVLWLSELFEAQGRYERAAKYLLAGFSDNEQANDYIRKRLPFIYAKLGHDSSAAAAALSEAERRFNSLTAVSSAIKEEMKSRALADRVGRPAPEFKVLTLDKKLIRLGDLRGKVVVLNFWATWCGPCVAEMPHLQTVADKYKGNQKVVILAVSTDENRLAVRGFLEKNRYTLLAAYDDGAAESFDVRRIPTTFIIDGGGVIQFKEEGFGAGGSDYVERMGWRVDELLKERTGSGGVKQD